MHDGRMRSPYKGIQYRSCRRAKYRPCEQPIGYAESSGDNGSDGDGYSAGGSAKADRIGIGYYYSSWKTGRQKPESAGDCRGAGV